MNILVCVVVFLAGLGMLSVTYWEWLTLQRLKSAITPEDAQEHVQAWLLDVTLMMGHRWCAVCSFRRWGQLHGYREAFEEPPEHPCPEAEQEPRARA